MTNRPLRLKSISVDPAVMSHGETRFIGVTRVGYSTLLHAEDALSVVETAYLVHSLAERHRVDTVYINATGIGAALVDLVYKEDGRDYEVIAVNPARLR